MNDQVNNNCFGGLIAFTVVAAFCFFAVWIGLRAVPAVNAHIIDITLGVLAAKFSGVVDFYFGSSRSAERAQAHIAAVTPAAQPSLADGATAAGAEPKKS